MAQTINLNMLKSEIDSRKREKNQVSANVNGVATTMPARDAFLSGLLESFQTGKDTHSSVVVKEVVNKVAEKAGENAPIRQQATLPISNSQPRRISENDMSPERDEQLFADLQKKRSSTLVESIQDLSKVPMIGSPMNNQVPSSPMQLNEAYLTESVKNIVNTYLVENFGPIIEESIKSSILEMYAAERIKAVLAENKEMVRTMVKEVVKEMSDRQKALKAQQAQS